MGAWRTKRTDSIGARGEALSESGTAAGTLRNTWSERGMRTRARAVRRADGPRVGCDGTGPGERGARARRGCACGACARAAQSHMGGASAGARAP